MNEIVFRVKLKATKTNSAIIRVERYYMNATPVFRFTSLT